MNNINKEINEILDSVKMNKETYDILTNAFWHLKGIHEEARINHNYDFKALNYYSEVIKNIEKLYKNEFDEVKKVIFEFINIGWIDHKKGGILK